MLPFTDAVAAIFTQESGRLWNVVVAPHVSTRVLGLLRAHGSGGRRREIARECTPRRERASGRLAG